jgi:hypothetical protein
MTQKFFWTAGYADGTQLYQFENGVEHSSEQISRAGLRSFSIRGAFGQDLLTLVLLPDDLFSYRCRTMLKSNGGEPERVHIVCYIRERTRSVMFIKELDNSIEIADFSDDLQYKHQFHPVPADLIPIT